MSFFFSLWIFNQSVAEGCFPTAMKTAKVIPIHKGDSVLSAGNYRPISLLPIFSKIFERLIYNRLISFITDNKILSELQFGFQSNKSTEQAVTTIISTIEKAKEEKKSSYCIFLDFAKAFDTVATYRVCRLSAGYFVAYVMAWWVFK